MINLWLLAYRAYYRNDIKPYIAVDVAIFDIVVNGQTETLQLSIVDSLFRISIEAVSAGLDFNEYYFLAVGCYDVDIAPT